MFRFWEAIPCFFFVRTTMEIALSATKVLLHHFRDVIFRKDLFGDDI